MNCQPVLRDLELPPTEETFLWCWKEDNHKINQNHSWLGLLENVTKSPKSLVFLKPTKSPLTPTSRWLSVSEDSEKLEEKSSLTLGDFATIGPVKLSVLDWSCWLLKLKPFFIFISSALFFIFWMCLGLLPLWGDLVGLEEYFTSVDPAGPGSIAEFYIIFSSLLCPSYLNSPRWKLERDLAIPCFKIEWSGVAS